MSRIGNGGFIPAGGEDINVSPVYLNFLTLPPTSVGQGTWALSIGTYNVYNAHLLNTSNGNGDNLSFKTYLPKGTYTLSISAIKGTNCGILNVDIGGSLGDIDLYAASSSYVTISEITGVALEAGAHTLKLTANDKNASSTAYYLYLSAVTFRRTA